MQLAPGSSFGPYEITAKLGEGGMGEVWRARDLRLDRDVALKVLPEKFTSDPERTARFEREARLLAQLNHPNIAQVFGLEVAGGTRALVMELVEGPTLAERLARESLPLAEALAIARQLAEALEEAHDRGIVHRDLKPQNVKITPRGRVKVLDFGLAKALASEGPAGAALADASTLGADASRPGMILGTASYMAPEQVRGAEVDRRADIWSFGVVLCEVLTGEKLFAGPSLVEILSAVLHRPLDFDRLSATTPTPVRALLARCLERDPKRRLQSIGEARVLLEDLAASPGATPGYPSPEDSAASALPSVAVLPFVNMSADPENEFFADGITEDVIAHLAKIRTLRVTSRTSVMAFKKREQSLGEIGAALGVRTILEGSVRRSRNRVRIVAQLVDPRTDEHLWAESYDRDLDDIFAIQTDVALQIAAALRAELSSGERKRISSRPTRDLEAYQLYLQGRGRFLEYSKEGILAGLVHFEQAIVRDPGFALAHAAIAHAHTSLATESHSGILPLQSFGHAQAAVDRALALDGDLAEAHDIVGLLRLVRDYDWGGAEAEFHLALRLSPGSADIHDHLGWLYSGQCDFEKSLDHIRRARELDPLAHRSDYPNELLRAGHLEEALIEATRALALHPQFPRCHGVYGWALLLSGRIAEGVAAIERAAELSPGNAQFLGQLGQAYGMAGEAAKARAILARLETMTRAEFVPSYHPAYVHVGLGEHETALDHLERALDQRSGSIFGIKGSYLFAPLRGHPRFEAILKRMNL